MGLKNLALAAVVVLAAPAHADVADAVNDRILPDLAAFRGATRALADTAAQTCDPAALRPAWNAAFDAWIPVSFLRLGPAEEHGRILAIAFWPDPKGIGARQLRQLRASQDPVVTDPAGFAERSVALRGFFALERLLYPAEPLTGDYICALIRATSADLARVAAEIDQGWRDDFAQTLLSAGEPGNTRYLTEAEAKQALFTQLMTGFEFTADQRLGRPLGTFDRPRPERAEARASARSQRNVELSLQALLAFGQALAGPLPETRANVERALAATAALNDPDFSGLAQPQGHVRAEALQGLVRSAQDSAGAEAGAALGVDIGFNSADGD
jgi:predicted lipoprotein